MHESLIQVRLTVSPFRPSFSPQCKVYPQPFDSCNPCAPKSPFVFNRLRTLYLSCRSFCDSCPLFSITCALFDKNTRGVGVSAAPSRPLSLCVIVCLGLRTRASPVPFRSCISFRINTCEKPRGRGYLTHRSVGRLNHESETVRYRRRLFRYAETSGRTGSGAWALRSRENSRQLEALT